MTTLPMSTPVPLITEQPVRDFEGVQVRARVSWGPIMMGAISAIGLQFIFTLLGLAIGVTAVDPAATPQDSTSTTEYTAQAVSVAAGSWWLVTGIIALAAGGYVFGRLSGMPRSLPLQLEALAMWSVVAIFGFVVVWSAGGMLAAASSPMGVIAHSARSWSINQPAMSRDLRDSTDTRAPADVRRSDQASASLYTPKDQRAVRTAAWWSVIGLLAGVGAVVVGACMGVPGEFRYRNA